MQPVPADPQRLDVDEHPPAVRRGDRRGSNQTAYPARARGSAGGVVEQAQTGRCARSRARREAEYENPCQGMDHGAAAGRAQEQNPQQHAHRPAREGLRSRQAERTAKFRTDGRTGPQQSRGENGQGEGRVRWPRG